MSSLVKRSRRGRAAISALLALAVAIVPVAPAAMAAQHDMGATASTAGASGHCDSSTHDHATGCPCAHACTACGHAMTSGVVQALVLAPDAGDRATGVPASARHILPPGLPERPPQRARS